MIAVKPSPKSISFGIRTEAVKSMKVQCIANYDQSDQVKQRAGQMQPHNQWYVLDLIRIWVIKPILHANRSTWIIRVKILASAGGADCGGNNNASR